MPSPSLAFCDCAANDRTEQSHSLNIAYQSDFDWSEPSVSLCGPPRIKFSQRERPATKLRDLRHFWRISLFARHHLPYGDSRRRSSDALRLEKPRREYRPDGGGRQKEHASQPGSDATPVPMTIKIRTLGSGKCFFERTKHTNTQARAAITICYRGYQKTLWLTAPLGGAISLPRTLRELTHEEGRMFPRPSFASGLGS